ncbi:Deacetylase [compost metagenome]
MDNLLSVGARAEFTLFDLVDSELRVFDSLGAEAHLNRLFEPRYAVMGTEVVAANRYQPPHIECPDHSQGYVYR